MLLKPHQLDLLRSTCQRGSVPAAELDGRALRPLLRLGLVTDVHGTVQATPKGRAIAQEDHPPAPPRQSRQTPLSSVLSARQEEVLRYLVRQIGPVPADHLDGRVVAALVARGLVLDQEGWVSPSSTAEQSLRTHSTRDRARSLRRAANPARGARGEAILRATDMLEQALPRGAELMIAEIPAYGDDVVAGLRKLAREME